jgi:outer membrane lipoprotein-sorting protein
MKAAAALILGALPLALLVPARAGTAEGPPEARRLLQQAHAAAGRVAYSGRQITVMWGRRETAVTETQEYHAADGRLRIETRRPFTERGRVVVDDGRTRWQYEPSRRVVDQRASIAVDAGPPVDQLLQAYTGVVEPAPERAAGRRTWRLELHPRYAGKPVRRMWIDAGTGLVLRYEQSREDGRLLSASRYTEVRLGEPSAALFTRPGPPGTRVAAARPAPRPLSLAGARARFGVALPAELPAGYRFADATLLSGRGYPVAHLRYRDGLSTVSLYVGRWGSLRYEPGRGQSLRLREGVGHLYSRGHIYFLSWRSPLAEFALVGDASPPLLAQLANGIAPAIRPSPMSVPLRMVASRWLLGLALLLLVLSAFSLARHRRIHHEDTETRRSGTYSRGWTR